MSRSDTAESDTSQDTSTSEREWQRAAFQRDKHGFRTDMGNRKARRAAWAKTRKIRARFEALMKKGKAAR